MSVPFSNSVQNNHKSSIQQAPQPVIRSHPPATFRQINSSFQQAPHMHQNVSSIPQRNNTIPEASRELMMRRRLPVAANQQQNQSSGFGLVQQQDMLAYLQHHAQQNLHGQNANHLGPHHQQLSSQRQQQNVRKNASPLASNQQQLMSQRQPQTHGQNVNCLASNQQQLSSQRQQQNVAQNVNTLSSNHQQLLSHQRQQQTLGQNANLLVSNHQQLSSQRQQQTFGQNGNPLPSNHQILLSQRQQQTFGQNVNLSGPHHAELGQRSMVNTQQQTLHRQMNASQVQMMQMPQTQQNGQQTHQMTGMPASTLSSGTKEIYKKVQILKTNDVGRLTSIYQKLDICLRNLDKQNVRKFEQVVKIHQLVGNTLKILDKMESNTAGITQKNLDDIEKKIKFILLQFADKKPVSTSAQQENSSVNVHAMSQQSVQLDSQTAQAWTDQDKMMQVQPMQAANQKLVETNMQQRNMTNLMTGSGPPILHSGTQHLQRRLAIKDSNQTSLPGNSTMPMHSTSQQSVKVPIHGQVSASDANTPEPRINQPKQMHLKQPLLQQNPRPVRTHSEAFPSPLAQKHGSSGQQVPTNTSQSEKNSLPVLKPATRNPLKYVPPPPRFPPSAPKDTRPMLVTSEKPTSDAALNSSMGNIRDEQVRAPAEAPSPSTLATQDTSFVSVNSQRPHTSYAVLHSPCVDNTVDEQIRDPAEAPSSSTALAPKDTSPVPVNSERPTSDAALHSSCVGIIRDEQVIAPSEAPSPSATLPEKPNDDIHSEKSTVNSDELPPIQRLIKAISSTSDQALACSASDIASAVYEQYDRFGMKRPRRKGPESETCHKMKRPRLATKEIIAEEIETINQKLLQTELNISAPSAKYDEGTPVTCCFLGKYFIPGSKPSPVISLQMLVPADYPSQSPKIVGSRTVYKAAHAGHEPEDLSAKVMSKVIHTLRTFDSPFSLQQIAFAWDRGAQEVICGSEQQDGKGSSVSIGKGWEYFTVANPR